MMPRSLPGCFIGLLLLLTAGCGGSLLPKSAPPVYYQLDYQPTPVPCRETFEKGLRVMTFSAASQYQRTEMVVLERQGQVAFSNRFQWVATPGTMVSESLLRDLTQSHLFPQVLSANEPATVPLELTGYVFKFAWERVGGISRAALKVEVSLVETRKTRQVLLHRQYDLQGEPMPEDSSAAFAGAMSEVMKRFSEKLQQDLCKVVKSRQAEKNRQKLMLEESEFEHLYQSRRGRCGPGSYSGDSGLQ
jgi:ABC-type uncharacterized transport system auxiliary subunit